MHRRIFAVSMITLYYCCYCNLTVPHHLLLDFNQSSQRRCTNKQGREKPFTALLLMYVIYLHESAIKDPTVLAGLFSCELKEAPWLRSFNAGLTLCYNA